MHGLYEGPVMKKPFIVRQAVKALPETGKRDHRTFRMRQSEDEIQIGYIQVIVYNTEHFAVLREERAYLYLWTHLH